MIQPNRPSFSDSQLFLGEIAQYSLYALRLDRLPPVRAAINKVVGSDCESYQQMLWLPPWKVGQVNIEGAVAVQGASKAKGPAKNWTDTTVVGLNKDDLFELEDKDPEALDAISYHSSRAWHIGVLSVRELTLFRYLDKDRLAYALRQGRGDMLVAPGKYNWKTKRFSGLPAGTFEVVDTNLRDKELPVKYPGVLLG